MHIQCFDICWLVPTIPKEDSKFTWNMPIKIEMMAVVLGALKQTTYQKLAGDLAGKLVVPLTRRHQEDTSGQPCHLVSSHSSCYKHNVAQCQLGMSRTGSVCT